jgi:hypothetical protein
MMCHISNDRDRLLAVSRPPVSRSHAGPRLGQYCLHHLGPRKRSPDCSGRGRRLRALPADSKMSASSTSSRCDARLG